MNINQATDLQEKMWRELFKKENGFTLNVSSVTKDSNSSILLI